MPLKLAFKIERMNAERNHFKKSQDIGTPFHFLFFNRFVRIHCTVESRLSIFLTDTIFYHREETKDCKL